MLYCGEDHWAPEFHQDDIKKLQGQGRLPNNIHLSYMKELRHDYVSHDHMVPTVVDWCFQSMVKHQEGKSGLLRPMPSIQSRL